MKIRAIGISIILLALTAGLVALAEENRPERRRGPGHFDPTYGLTLTDEQVEAFKETGTRYRREMRHIFDQMRHGTDEERAVWKEELKDMKAQEKAELLELLTDDQKADFEAAWESRDQQRPRGPQDFKGRGEGKSKDERPRRSMDGDDSIPRMKSRIADPPMPPPDM